MKFRLILIFFGVISLSCSKVVTKQEGKHCQLDVKRDITSDTLAILKYNNYNFIFLKTHQSTDDKRKLLISRNNNGYKEIIIPSSDDVKNFSINSVEKIDNNMMVIIVNWGGGNNFYKRKFIFELENGNFFLSEIIKQYYRTNEEVEEKSIIINPKLNINQFNLMDYIENE